MAAGHRLVVVPGLPVAQDGDRFVLTRKFIAGVEEYQRRWPGPLQVVMEPTHLAGNNLDNVAVSKDELPFELIVLPYVETEMERVLRGAALAMLTVHYRQTHLAEVCARLDVPCTTWLSIPYARGSRSSAWSPPILCGWFARRSGR